MKMPTPRKFCQNGKSIFLGTNLNRTTFSTWVCIARYQSECSGLLGMPYSSYLSTVLLPQTSTAVIGGIDFSTRALHTYSKEPYTYSKEPNTNWKRLKLGPDLHVQLHHLDWHVFSRKLGRTRYCLHVYHSTAVIGWFFFLAKKSDAVR